MFQTPMHDDLKLAGKPDGSFAGMRQEVETLYAWGLTGRDELDLHPERDPGQVEQTIEPVSVIRYCQQQPRRKYVNVDVEKLGTYALSRKDEYLFLVRGACPRSKVTWWNFAAPSNRAVVQANLGDHPYWQWWRDSFDTPRKTAFLKQLEWINIGMFLTHSGDNFAEWKKRNEFRVELTRSMLREINHDIPVFVTISPHYFQDPMAPAKPVCNGEFYGQILDELNRIQVDGIVHWSMPYHGQWRDPAHAGWKGAITQRLGEEE